MTRLCLRSCRKAHGPTPHPVLHTTPELITDSRMLYCVFAAADDDDDGSARVVMMVVGNITTTIVIILIIMRVIEEGPLFR